MGVDSSCVQSEQLNWKNDKDIDCKSFNFILENFICLQQTLTKNIVIINSKNHNIVNKRDDAKTLRSSEKIE